MARNSNSVDAVERQGVEVDAQVQGRAEALNDDDVAKRIERFRKQRDSTLRDAGNQALREGLQQLEMPRHPRKAHMTRAVSLGGCLIGNVDDVAEILAVADGDAIR